MNEKIKNNLEFLLAFYNATQSEITRYRDREYATLGIFVAALVATVGFIVTNEKETQRLRLAFDVILVVLAFGNIFYFIFMHNRLTIQRNVLKRLQYLFELHKIKVGKYKIVPFDLKIPENDNFFSGWMEGFWSHIFPFILTGIVLCFFGIWLLHGRW